MELFDSSIRLDPSDELVARRALGLATSRDHVAWAIEQLVRGQDSPNLRMLAGLDPPLYWSDVESHFEKALAEMELELPDADHAVAVLAIAIARRIIDGRLSPYRGVRMLHELTCQLNLAGEYGRWEQLDAIRSDLEASGIPNWLASMSPGTFERTVRSEATAMIDELSSL